jgi:hypothetical protein
MKKSFDFIQAENEFRFPSSMNGWQSLLSVMLSKLVSACTSKQASKQGGNHFYISDWDDSVSVCCRVSDVSVWFEREQGKGSFSIELFKFSYYDEDNGWKWSLESVNWEFINVNIFDFLLF